MFGSMLAVLALAFMLLMGGAGAGEDLMFMRAAPRDGRANVDMSGARPGWAPDGREAPAERAAAPAVADGVDFVGWQDARARRTAMIGGEPLEMATPGGFGLARPPAGRPPAGGEVFLETLIGELARE